MTDLKNPFAELNKPDSGELVTPAHVKEVFFDRKYFCPDSNCLDPERRLYLTHKGDLYFFSHYSGFEHGFSFETLLHKLAIRQFVELEIFQIPEFIDERGNFYPEQSLTLDCSKTEVEYAILKGIRPDVLIATTNGLQLAIEIFVTHEVTNEKIKKIQLHGLPALELDFSDFYKANLELCKTDIDFLGNEVEVLIADNLLKSWRNNPTSEQVKGKLINGEKGKSNLGYILFVALVFLAFVYWFFNREKSTRFKNYSKRYARN